MLGTRRKYRVYLNLVTHLKTTTATLKCNFVLPTSYIMQAEQPAAETFERGTAGERGDDTQSPAEGIIKR